MGYDSNVHCLYTACQYQCCDYQGLCPASSLTCYYQYDSYYCQNPCTKGYFYSQNPCPSSCSAGDQQGGYLIGMIVGSVVLFLILSFLACYCCNRQQRKVAPDIQARTENNKSMTGLNNNSHNETVISFTATFNEEGEVAYGKPIPHWRRTMLPSFN